MPMVRVWSVGHHELYLAAADDGMIELADLIALRQVGIEVVLTVEVAAAADLGADRDAERTAILHDLLIQHRQRAREVPCPQRSHASFGAAPNAADAPEKIFERVLSCV